MENKRAFLLSLMNKALHQKDQPDSPCLAVAYDTYNQALQGTGLHTILYPYVRFNPDAGSGLVQKILMHQLMEQQKINHLMARMHEAGLSPLIIKGLAIARLYSHPEYRTMEDLDILVEEKQFSDAKAFLAASGYKQTEADDYHPLHIKFEKEGQQPIELHRGLIHTGLLGQRSAEEWYRHIWDHKQTVQEPGLTFEAMSLEDELINQIIHFSSHFVYYGIKLKHLFEIALILKYASESLDWDYMTSMLQQLGFLAFGRLLFSVCKEYFRLEMSEAIPVIPINRKNDMMAFLISCTDASKSSYNGWINVLNRYQWIIRHPVLLPLAWAIECKAQLNLNGLKPLIILSNARANLKAIRFKIRIINDYKLMLDHAGDH